jgi:DNA-directed RNA polymerase subunit F
MKAQEGGEQALTKLRDVLTALQSGQAMMAQHFVEINQAAINRAVRDLLSVSDDQEALAGNLAEIPRDTNSATRAFADEQHLLIKGTERVSGMLQEVAKDTPFLDSRVGKQLGEGVRVMKEAAYGLENGAVHLARDDGDQAVEEINGVVIALLRTASSMSSCASGMPMSSFMQQLQNMTGDQQKLNGMIQDLLKQGGSPLDRRLQQQLRTLGEEQQRIRDQLQQLLDESGSGQGLLGRLDSVTDTLDEVAKRLKEGRVDEETIRQQDWALTRLLDSQRSIRERDLGRERRSKTGDQDLALTPPGALPEGMEKETRDLREDLLRALERRYPPKYEDLIRRYFRSLTEEGTTPDLP